MSFFRERRKYHIWSIEHDAWWKPNKQGYTKNLALAGEYGQEEALDIIIHSNIVSFNECMIPSDCLEADLTLEAIE